MAEAAAAADAAETAAAETEAVEVAEGEAQAKEEASAAGAGKRRKRWFPLESNPDVMNAYVTRLGMDTSTFRFCDVLSMDDWAQEMVPQPVKAVVFLYPIKESSEVHRREEKERIDSEGQVCSENVYYMKQTVGNACGTVGILHAIGNARADLQITDGSWLQRFYERTQSMTPAEIADDLEADEEIDETHGDAAQQGQSDQKALEERVETHFICFSEVDGHLYELDGRKASPINHGPTTSETLLADACNAIREFIARDPGEHRFTIVALAANTGDDG